MWYIITWLLYSWACRQNESQRQKQSDQPAPQQHSPSLILRAELTVTTVLKVSLSYLPLIPLQP